MLDVGGDGENDSACVGFRHSAAVVVGKGTQCCHPGLVFWGGGEELRSVGRRVFALVRTSLCFKVVSDFSKERPCIFCRAEHFLLFAQQQCDDPLAATRG